MKLSTAVIIVLTIALAAIVGFMWWNSTHDAGIEIASVTDEKILYQKNDSLSITTYRSHCESQGGRLSDCADRCADDQAVGVCASDCELICELTQDEPVSIQQEFNDKIVYTTNLQTDADPLRRDCAQRGGKFNECGSVCEDSATICIEVCAYTCELTVGETMEIPPDWKSHTDNTVGFFIAYPPTMTVTTRQDGHIAFSLWGSTQREGTELFDGIALEIGRETKAPEQTVGAYVAEKIAAEPQNQIVNQPQEISLAGTTAIAYTSQSLGTYRHLYLPTASTTLLSISYISADPTNQGYDDIISLMLKSLRVTSQ